MEIIYEPSGKAKEYAQLAANLYKGCDHRCTYCFGPSTLRKKREIFHTVNRPAKDALIRLAKDAEKLGKARDEREILLSFVTDPYQTIENDLRITRQAIEILIKNNLRFTILTKGGPTAARDFDLLKNYDKASFGSTICFTKQEDADKWEPNAPEIDMRIETIKAAHEMGIRTWVSLEPVIDTDQALELIGEIHPFVDHWKVGKLNYKKLEVNWLKFCDEVTALFVSKGAKYYLKKSLRDIKEPKKNNPPKSVSIAGNGNRKSKEDEEAGPWTEGDIPTRKGNRSILVIAPHGHPGDDKGTYQLARRLADELNCYAVVNNKYRKPKNAGLKAPSLRDCAADLNCWSHVNKFKKLQKDFREPIQKYKNEIIAEHNALLILHIHGIGNDNRKRVAKLLPEFKDRPADLHLLIGYGQHRDNDKTLITANVDKLVKPLMTELHKSGVKSAIAPTQHIFDKNDEKQWYCGNHKKKLNQKLCNPKDKVQSLQLEFKYGGLRDKPKEAALKFAKAVKVVLEVEDKDQNQNAAVPETAASRKHKIYTDFMAIIQRNSESAMLEAGQFLFNTFYKNEIEAAKDDKKKEPLNSLHEYIQDHHGNDPVAPKKSWIYNSVKLAVEYKELKAYLKDDFHMYGNGLNLSQKVLLFTENDLEKKIQIIRETAAFIEKSGKPLTFVEFKNRFDASRSKQKRNGTRNPSLLSLIGNPEKLIATEISKLLTPESLQKRNLPELKKLHSRASDCISAIQEKIKIQTDYLTRYKEISETLEKAAKDKAGKSLVKAQPELKTVTPVIISASRATDIPAFHSEWFLNRLREGYCIWKNPYGGGNDRVSFKSTRLIVFWTKNPKPILPRLKELDERGFNYYFLYTLNDYEAENLEPNLPTLEHRIETFKRLSDRIGKKRVIWRFDPLVLTDQITKEQLVEKVSKIGNQLKGFTEKLVVSFAKVEQHRKVKNNLKKEGINHLDFTETDINYVANQLAQFGNDFGMKVGTCAENYDLTKIGIERNKCIDDEFIKNVFSNDAALMDYMGNGGSQKHQGQRQLCGCIASKDIGAYDTCKYFCKYCYATVSQKTVNKNFKYKINLNNESLLGD